MILKSAKTRLRKTQRSDILTSSSYTEQVLEKNKNATNKGKQRKRKLFGNDSNINQVFREGHSRAFSSRKYY